MGTPIAAGHAKRGSDAENGPYMARDNHGNPSPVFMGK
jgi:hypothetical protein